MYLGQICARVVTYACVSGWYSHRAWSVSYDIRDCVWKYDKSYVCLLGECISSYFKRTPCGVLLVRLVDGCIVCTILGECCATVVMSIRWECLCRIRKSHSEERCLRECG